MTARPVIVHFQGHMAPTPQQLATWYGANLAARQLYLELVGKAPAVAPVEEWLLEGTPARTDHVSQEVYDQLRAQLPALPGTDFWSVCVLGVADGGRGGVQLAALGEDWLRANLLWAIAHEWGHEGGLADLTVDLANPLWARESIMAQASRYHFPAMESYLLPHEVQALGFSSKWNTPPETTPMPSPADSWALPPFEGTEEGAPYFTLPTGQRAYWLVGRWADGFPDNPTEKMGYAIHHAVTGAGNGSLASELAIADAIFTHHTVTNGWAGIGYHRLISATGRIFLVGRSSQQRAHVAGLNHLWIGICFLGDHTLAANPPTAVARKALIDWTQWETNQRQVPMKLAPHKRLNPGETDCPGAWAAVSSWEGITLNPAAPPPPPPAGPTVGELKAQILAAAQQLPD